VGIFAHQNADPDAISSAVGLKYILKQYFPKVRFTLFAQSINIISKKLLLTGNEVFQSDTVPNDLDIIFICDANNIQQLGNISLNDFISQKKPIIIIDHHEKIEQAEEITHSIINTETSTAEMIGKIYEELEIALEPKIATLLLTGILFDTRRFIYRTASTFNTVQFLINSGGNYDEALSILQKEPSKSEKIARLKGATRTLIHKEGTDIYALTYVSSYESSVARALVGLGASIAVVLAVPSDKEYRISMRCTKTFAERNKISLGTLANVISANFEGSGGGHQTAAGINFHEPKEFPKKKEEIVQMLLKMLLKEIKQK
jgi:nanoRNase/pAp phosphatase (c-di-AMP/oligoRNAs hydrolase)